MKQHHYGFYDEKIMASISLPAGKSPRRGRNLTALKEYVVNLVASRFVSGDKIPTKICKDSDALCEKAPQALIPWKATAGKDQKSIRA